MLPRTNHKKLYSSARRGLYLFPIILLFGVWLEIGSGVGADELIDRSIQISSAQTSVTATDQFNFTYATNSTIGSVVFEYCDNSPLFLKPCNAPAGLDVTGAAIANQNGVAGFGVDNVHTTANSLVITRVPINAPAVASFYQFTNITNPSVANETIYVRISTYASADTSGPATDSGAVAFATENAFNVGANVPPYIDFCSAISVASDCSTAAGDSIDLGVLSANQPAYAQSQFAVATNSETGYDIYGLGTTMTSGNNVINNLASPSPSVNGTSQFGINLRANASPFVGQEPSGTGSGIPSSNYDSPNLFMYQPGDLLAASNLPTNFNRLTVSYLVNVKPAQPIGLYATTISYLAVAQF